MGWSQAKIARALGAAVQTQSDHTSGIRKDVAELIANLAETTGEVRLFVHHYHGSFAEERVVSKGTRIMAVNELRRDGHANIVEDTVYMINKAQ